MYVVTRSNVWHQKKTEYVCKLVLSFLSGEPDWSVGRMHQEMCVVQERSAGDEPVCIPVKMNNRDEWQWRSLVPEEERRRLLATAGLAYKRLLQKTVARWLHKKPV